MKRTLLILALGLFVWSLCTTTAGAIPAFARKYGFNCNMCHAGFTRLNDFGQRYRDNGYQIPGQTGGEKTVFESGPPIALRTAVGLSAYKDNVVYMENKHVSSSFGIYGFDLLAAGVFHKNVSFLLIYTPRVDEPAGDFNGPGDTGGNPGQLGGIESANIVFSNLVEDKLNVRVGRFEPAYHPFSSKRKYTLFQPYEIYSFSTPSNSFVFDDNQIGIEATGHLDGGFKYALGVVNGTGGNPDNNNAKDLYLNLSQGVGKGEGQNAGHRIGILGYFGWQPADTTWVRIAPPTGATNGRDNKQFYRVGVDGSFNYEHLNLNLLFMKGTDNKQLNSADPTKDYEFTGGFAELNWAGLMNDRLIVSFLYNWVRPPSYHSQYKINAVTTTVRYYVGDWSAVNVGLHGEYTYRRTGSTSPLQEHLVALAVDFAF